MSMKIESFRQAAIGVGLFVFCIASSLVQAGEIAKSPYGPDDEIGVLNELTQAHTLAILQRVSSGKTYDLSVDNFVGMPGLADLGLGDPPFHMWLTHTPRGLRVEEVSPAGSPLGLALYDDAYTLSAHTGTHIDALNHLGRGDKIFNGYDASTYLSDKGWTKAGADKVPPIITRGILIDVADEKGMTMLPDSYAITIQDLQRAMKKQGISLQKNDAVLIRTGRMTAWPDPKEYVHNDPGITRESAAWLVDSGAVIIGADNMGVEKFPMAEDSVHVYLFTERGVCLLELLWLEDLAKDQVYEFAFIAAPIKMRGATGSPIRPIGLPISAIQDQ